MDRPSFILQTVYFHDSEQPEALRLEQAKFRAELLKADEPDRANYILYGERRFKLVRRLSCIPQE